MPGTARPTGAQASPAGPSQMANPGGAAMHGEVSDLSAMQRVCGHPARAGPTTHQATVVPSPAWRWGVHWGVLSRGNGHLLSKVECCYCWHRFLKVREGAGRQPVTSLLTWHIAGGGASAWRMRGCNLVLTPPTTPSLSAPFQAHSCRRGTPERSRKQGEPQSVRPVSVPHPDSHTRRCKTYFQAGAVVAAVGRQRATLHAGGADCRRWPVAPCSQVCRALCR